MPVIPADHNAKLIALGSMADLAGRLRMTTQGKVRIAAAPITNRGGLTPVASILARKAIDSFERRFAAGAPFLGGRRAPYRGEGFGPRLWPLPIVGATSLQS